MTITRRGTVSRGKSGRHTSYQLKVEFEENFREKHFALSVVKDDTNSLKKGGG